MSKSKHLAGKYKSLKLDNDSEGRPSPTLKARLKSHTDNLTRLIEDWYEDGCEIDVEFRPSGTGDEVPGEKRADLQGEIKSFKVKPGDDGHPEPVIKLDLQPDVYEVKSLLEIWAEAEGEFVMVLESLQIDMFDAEADEDVDETSDAPDPDDTGEKTAA